MLEGELAHKDSMGNGSVIRPGDVQRMSRRHGRAALRVQPLEDAVTHFLQIWIEPNRVGIAPGYEERRFAAAESEAACGWSPPPDGREGSVTIHQDANVYVGLFDARETATLELAVDRLGYVHVARGGVSVNGVRLGTGDAAKLAAETAIALTDGDAAEVLVFDLPRSR